MKTLTIRIDNHHIDELEKLYKSKTNGAEKAVDGFLSMRKYIIMSLKGLFTKEEITGLVAIQNGLLLESKYQSNLDMFVAEIEDAEKFDSISKFYGLNIEKLIKKIKVLNPAQVYFLHEEIDRFWNLEKAYGSPNPDLNKFIEDFS